MSILFLYCVPADACCLRSDQGPEGQHQQVFQKHKTCGFLIVQEGEGNTEEQIVRHTVSQEQPEADSSYEGEKTGQEDPGPAAQLHTGCHCRDMHSQMKSHQHERPV